MIVVRTPPSEGHALVQAALRHAPATDESPWRIGQPMPLFRLTASAAAHEEPISRARWVGWRYPLLSGEHYALACLIIRSKHLVFTSLDGPVFAHRLFAAAEFAERELASTAVKYQPRLLEISALRMFVLWFFARSKKSQFVVIKLPHREGGDFRLEGDISSHFRKALSHGRGE